MTFAQHTWHLLKRDLGRIARWYALYVGMLLVAAARAVGANAAATVDTSSLDVPVLSTGLAIVVVIALAIAVVRLMRSDNPLQAQSFWTTQPVRPLALASARLLLLLLLAATGAMVQGGVLTAWGYDVSSMTWAMLTALASLLLLALGVALLTIAIGERVAAGVRRPTIGWQQRGAAIASGAVMLAAYLRFAPAATPFAAGGQHARAAAVTPLSRRVALQIPLTTQPVCNERWLVIPLRVTSAAWQRVELTEPALTLVLTSGDSVHLTNREWMQSAGLWGPLAPATLHAQGRWARGDVGEQRVRPVDIAFTLTTDQRSAVCGKIAHVALQLRQRVGHGVELMRLPLDAPARVASQGYRATVRSTARTTVRTTPAHDAGADNARLTLTAQVDALRPTVRGGADETVALDFALLRPATGELIRLETDGAGEWRRRSDLPGLTRGWGAQRLALDPEDARAMRVSINWQQGALVVVTAPVWQEHTRERVTVTLPSQLAQNPGRRIDHP